MLVDFIKELFAGLSKKGRLESLNEAIDFSEKSQDYIEMMHYCNRVLQLDPCNHVAIEKILNYSSKIEDPQEELFLLDEVVS
ncbi:MAG: hypothetical protein KDI30_06250, partial [Pseudomonadales bacterium]|nr:hypothetical protein [Pseudomonadales bacterium]